MTGRRSRNLEVKQPQRIIQKHIQLHDQKVSQCQPLMLQKARSSNNLTTNTSDPLSDSIRQGKTCSFQKSSSGSALEKLLSRHREEQQQQKKQHQLKLLNAFDGETFSKFLKNNDRFVIMDHEDDSQVQSTDAIKIICSNDRLGLNTKLSASKRMTLVKILQNATKEYVHCLFLLPIMTQQILQFEQFKAMSKISRSNKKNKKRQDHTTCINGDSDKFTEDEDLFDIKISLTDEQQEIESKEDAQWELCQLGRFLDQIQELVLTLFDVNNPVNFDNSGDFFFDEIIREQIEEEIYVRLCKTTSKSLLNAWIYKDLLFKYKIEKLSNRKQSFFNISNSYTSDWKTVISILNKGLGDEDTLPCQKLSSIIDAIIEIKAVCFRENESYQIDPENIMETDVIHIFMYCIVHADAIKEPYAFCILLRAFYDRKKDKKGYLDLFETALDNLSNISHYFIDDTPNTSLLL